MGFYRIFTGMVVLLGAVSLTYAGPPHIYCFPKKNAEARWRSIDVVYLLFQDPDCDKVINKHVSRADISSALDANKNVSRYLYICEIDQECVAIDDDVKDSNLKLLASAEENEKQYFETLVRNDRVWNNQFPSTAICFKGVSPHNFTHNKKASLSCPDGCEIDRDMYRCYDTYKKWASKPKTTRQVYSPPGSGIREVNSPSAVQAQ